MKKEYRKSVECEVFQKRFAEDMQYHPKVVNVKKVYKRKDRFNKEKYDYESNPEVFYCH